MVVEQAGQSDKLLIDQVTDTESSFDEVSLSFDEVSLSFVL